MQEYLQAIVNVLQKIELEEKGKMSLVAEKVTKVIENNGIIYVFGCGHSHLTALDVFYRAGGLANVCPILDTDLMLFDGAAKSSRMEKMSGIAEQVFRRYPITDKDILFIVSASGKNAVPLEMVDCGKKLGVYTVGISSSEYIAKGATLLKRVDVGIDCKVAYGDAVLSVGEIKMGGLSTYASLFIVNSILIEGAKKANDKGIRVPIYKSGNVEGGKEYNVLLEEEYFARVKHL